MKYIVDLDFITSGPQILIQPRSTYGDTIAT